MKILPTMSRGIVFLHEDGKTFEMAPFQVFVDSDGGTTIRIGRNAIVFDQNGRFSGTECKVGAMDDTTPEAKMLIDAFKLQEKGTPPEEAYYQPGTPGHAAETRAWVNAKREDAGEIYGVTKPKDRRH